MPNTKQTNTSPVYAPNEYFPKKMDTKKYLVTTRHGGFAFLSSEEYDMLRHGTFPENKALSEKLERAGLIITQKNTEQIITAFEKQYVFLLAPRKFIINISNDCNLRCRYCHANAGTGQIATMDIKTMDATINFILSAPINAIHIEFQGGEPLAKFELVREFIAKIKKSAEQACKRIASVVIVTNMTLMNEEIAKYILENEIGLCSSLDGPEEIHDAHRMFRGGGGTHKTVSKWLSYFSKLDKTVNALPTITSHSLKFGAKSIIDEYLRKGCTEVMLREVYPIGRAIQNKDLYITPEKFIQFWKEGIEYMAKLSLEGKIVFDPTILAMLKNVMGFPTSYMCMRKPCGAGVSQLSISPDGKIFPCDLTKTMPKLNIGTVHNSYIDIALKTLDLISRTSEAQPLCDTCEFGAYCGTCVAGAYATFSDTISRTPRDFECKVNKAMFTYIFEKMQNEQYMKVFELWIKQRR